MYGKTLSLRSRCAITHFHLAKLHYSMAQSLKYHKHLERALSINGNLQLIKEEIHCFQSMDWVIIS